MSRVIYYFIKKIIFILWVHVTTTPITDIHTDTPITTKIHRTDRKNHHRTQRKENNRGLNKNTKKLIILIVAVLVGIIILNELLGIVDGIWAFTLVWILGFVIITIIVIAIWLFMVALKGWASRRL